MKENISPEEKLLRLIRGHKKGGRGQDALKQLPAGQDIKVKFSYPKFIGHNFNLLLAKRLIAVAFFISCAYLVISYVYPLIGPKNIELPKITPEESVEKEPVEELKIQPFEFYSQGTQGRQVFSSPIIRPESQKETQNASLDLSKDLKLLGIVSGDTPQAIIEDSKNAKTYYLNKGQSIGDFLVEDIQDGKVILNYQGQKFELYL